MIPDTQLIRDKKYKVKITDPNMGRFYNRTAEVKFTGVSFRSLTKRGRVLYLSQVEVLELIKDKKAGSDQQTKLNL